MNHLTSATYNYGLMNATILVLVATAERELTASAATAEYPQLAFANVIIEIKYFSKKVLGAFKNALETTIWRMLKAFVNLIQVIVFLSRNLHS